MLALGLMTVLMEGICGNNPLLGRYTKPIRKDKDKDGRR